MTLQDRLAWTTARALAIVVMFVAGAHQATAQASDPASTDEVAPLDRIERTLVREPNYTTTLRYYACLAFGAKATGAMWVVIDGDHLYADLDGDRDLTDEGERFTAKRRTSKGLVREMVSFYPESIPKRGDRKEYVGFHATLIRYRPGVFLDAPDDPTERLERVVLATTTAKAKDPHVCTFSLRVSKTRTQHAQVVMGRRLADAPIMHFDGPLTLGLVEGLRPTALWRGAVPAKLAVTVGTAGRPARGAFVRTTYEGWPADARPEARIRFTTDDGKPFFRTIRFKGKC